MFYWFLKWVALGPWLKLVFRPQVSGAENVPATGPAILASNHLSYADWLFMPLTLPRRVTFVAKAEYFTTPGIKGWFQRKFFSGAGQVPIDRSGANAAEGALKTAKRILEDGELFGIYPEGTRSHDGKLYRGTGGGGLRDRVALVRNWDDRRFLVGPGDLDRDGDPDLVSRTPDGAIMVTTSDGNTGRERHYVAREKMFRTDMVTAAGYWNNDGARDLIVRRATTDQLYLLPGTADGMFAHPEPLPGGRNFSAYDAIIGVGYFNRDRYPDIIAREKGKGRLWLFAGSTSGLREREYVASDMDRYDLLG